jgi:PEP-CTERM motif
MNARCGAIVSALTLLSLSIDFAAPVFADPLPGEVLKFRQAPLNNGAVPGPPGTVVPGAPYFGHDELSTAYLQATAPIYVGTYMADDFADKFNSPVVHVRWWGSYSQNFVGEGGVKDFLISFESDVPVGTPNPLPYSHPGTPLLNQVVKKGPLAPGSGTFTEKLIPTPPMPGPPPMPAPEALYEYNAELHLGKEFYQQPDTVYWLKIVALVDAQRDGPIEWGWHDRDWSIPNPLASMPPAVVPGEGIISAGPIVDPIKGFTSPVWHFQDDAVTGPITITPTAMPNMPDIVQQSWTPKNYIFPADGPDIIQQFSKDLAFELYTRIPEPTALLLAGIGVLAVATTRRRRAK